MDATMMTPAEQVANEIAAEVQDLADKYGDMPNTAEAVYFHVTRAYRSLEAELLSKHPDIPTQIDRLEHLSAVAARAAVARMSGLR